MKFGVRECANIVFRAKQPIRIGTATFQAGQPVLYIDTATTSSMEQSTTTVYAQGGRGNARLLAWEGEKTLTFSFTDALLSPIGFAILSGAGLFKRGNGEDAGEGGDLVHFHMTSGANLTMIGGTSAQIDLRNAVAEFGTAAKVCKDDAPIYIMETEQDGSLTGKIYSGNITVDNNVITIANVQLDSVDTNKNAAVMVDYYVDLPGEHVYEADITPETFGGNYYVEADTLFRDQHTGKDLPANLTFPNVRLQSNFTMTFAGTGDPSTFDFTMDAFPDYTYFDNKKKVLCAMQIVDSLALSTGTVASAEDPVMYHDNVREDGLAGVYDSDITTEEKGLNVATFKVKTSAVTSTAHDGSESQKAYQIIFNNVKDATTLKDYLTIENSNGDDISSIVRPTFAVTSTGYQNYIDFDANDGYIVAKANSSAITGGIVITAAVTSTASVTPSSTAWFNVKVNTPAG